MAAIASEERRNDGKVVFMAGRSEFARLPGVPPSTITEAELEALPEPVRRYLRLVVEPGGAAALAAALCGKVPLDENSVIMLTGGNVDPAAFAETISAAG